MTKVNNSIMKKLKNLFKEKDIEYFSTDSDKKASIVERFNRTLKTRMWKYFTTHKTRRWIDTYDLSLIHI